MLNCLCIRTRRLYSINVKLFLGFHGPFMSMPPVDHVYCFLVPVLSPTVGKAGAYTAATGACYSHDNTTQRHANTLLSWGIKAIYSSVCVFPLVSPLLGPPPLPPPVLFCTSSFWRVLSCVSPAVLLFCDHRRLDSQRPNQCASLYS